MFVLIACLLLASYSYFWYPILLITLPSKKIARVNVAQQLAIRKIAVIIAARNEESKISKKLDNTLSLIRGDFLTEFIVASDASDDSTDSIVLSYQSRGIRLVRSAARLGKEHAQGLAIASTDADLLVFTDAGTILPADALTLVRAAFQDPSVGAVSSVDQFLTEEGSLQGEGAYVRYEMWLRDLESQFYSLVGLSGSFFAARKEVCQTWNDGVQSDFTTALNCVELGLRAVSDRQLIGYYNNISDARKEYSRKVRTVTRGMNSLRVHAKILDITRYGRFSFEVFSHKLMRWASPWFLLGALADSVVLALHDHWYMLLLAAQMAFYLTPLASRLVPSLRRLTLTRIPTYFVEVNVAIMHAAVLAFLGRTITTWEPSKR